MITVRGRLSVHPRGFGFLTFTEDQGGGEKTAFVAPPDLNPFLAGDLVSAEISAAGDGRLLAGGLSLLERSRTQLCGTIVVRRGRRFLRVDRLISNTDWPVQEEGPLPDLPDESPATATIVPGVPLRVRDVVPVLPGDFGLSRVLVRHRIRTEFPAALHEAARRGPVALGSRRDLRHLPTVTIDAPMSRDLDDALAVIPALDGAVRLLVSIADVDALVPAGSALDDEARERGTSVYLMGQVVPMLPPALSEDALSLLPLQDRPALTVELRIDAEGEVTAVDPYESLIRSHARLSYDQVAAFLDDGHRDVPEEAVATLRWLRTAAARLAVTRAGRGGVALLREEAYIQIDERSREPTGISARETGSAHALVERLMVAANEAVARWLFDRGLPALYRVHDEPTAEKVAALAEFARNFGLEPGLRAPLSPRGLSAFEAQFAGTRLAPALQSVLARVLGPARYTVHPAMHFGLAAPLYLHFTSPIRRYADLTVHRIVKGFLRGGRDLRPGDPALEALARHLNDAAYRAQKAEAERVRTLAARLFAGRSGERFAGNVTAVKPFGLIVQLIGTGVTGTIGSDALPAGRTYPIGEAVTVEIAGTNEELGRIDLVLA